MSNNTDNLIAELAASGMKIEDIVKNIENKRKESDRRQVARERLVRAFTDYVKVAVPEVEIKEADMKFISDELDDLEKILKLAAAGESTKTTDKKDRSKSPILDDRFYDWFLKNF